MTLRASAAADGWPFAENHFQHAPSAKISAGKIKQRAPGTPRKMLRSAEIMAGLHPAPPGGIA
jgi:hypothetical protein